MALGLNEYVCLICFVRMHVYVRTNIYIYMPYIYIYVYMIAVCQIRAIFNQSPESFPFMSSCRSDLHRIWTLLSGCKRNHHSCVHFSFVDEHGFAAYIQWLNSRTAPQHFGFHVFLLQVAEQIHPLVADFGVGLSILELDRLLLSTKPQLQALEAESFQKGTKVGEGIWCLSSMKKDVFPMIVLKGRLALALWNKVWLSALLKYTFSS